MKTKLLAVFLFFIATSSQLQARPSLGNLDLKLNALLSKVNNLNNSAVANTQAVCPSNAPTRFVDNGNGTVCDHQTGLMWERKNTLIDGASDPDNPRDVDNVYSRASSETDFLARLNGELASFENPAAQFAGYNDWRLPTISELMTISSCSFVGTCSAGITITNPVLGPTRAGIYLSSTRDDASLLNDVLGFSYLSDSVISTTGGFTALIAFVRAVRGGNRPETVIVPASTPGPAIPPGPIVPINPPPIVGPAPTLGPLTPLNP